MKWSAVISLSAVAAVYFQSVAAFGVQSKQDVSFSPSDMSRAQFLTVLGGLTAGAAPVWAKDGETMKGTKKDPSFEACLSTCMYECSKPKGAEQKSRAECLPECKEKCATSKAQLLKGDPK
jgi:hypothetical protein